MSDPNAQYVFGLGEKVKQLREMLGDMGCLDGSRSDDASLERLLGQHAWDPLRAVEGWLTEPSAPTAVEMVREAPPKAKTFVSAGSAARSAACKQQASASASNPWSASLKRQRIDEESFLAVLIYPGANPLAAS